MFDALARHSHSTVDERSKLLICFALEKGIVFLAVILPSIFPAPAWARVCGRFGRK
jgi:hypothetical protein